MQFTDITFHRQLFEGFRRMIANGRFPHTVMLSGRDGYGPLYLAMRIAGTLLCGEDETCLSKTARAVHPDLHFIYPTVTDPKAGAETHSLHYGDRWHSFISDSLFGGFDDWMTLLNAGNRQGIIRVKDAARIMREAYQYPVEAGQKVFIIWHAEKMNTGTANKLLKLLEEPPEHTYFILTVPDPLQVLSTIRSRSQIFVVPPISNEEMRAELQKTETAPARIEQILKAAGGDWHKARQILSGEDPFQKHKQYFVEWVRIAYMAKKKPEAINRLAEWTARIGNETRHFQLEFLKFTLETIRRSYLNRMGVSIPYFDFSGQNFQQEKLTPFIHSKNIEDFYRNLNDAVYHLMRNANAKPAFMDLSVRMTRLLHRKES